MRLPVAQRAGTQLDHEHTKNIMAPGPKRLVPVVHGVLDESQGVYQSGGELDNFVFWRLRLMTIAQPVWEQIKDVAKTIEIIDHPRNKCYSISTKEFAEHMVAYNAGIGPRVGAPLELWT